MVEAVVVVGRRSMSTLPRVQAVHAERFEVPGVAGHDHHACGRGDRGDKGVGVRDALGRSVGCQNAGGGQVQDRTRPSKAGSTLSSNHRRRCSPWGGSLRDLAMTPRSISAMVVAVTNWSGTGAESTQFCASGLNRGCARAPAEQTPHWSRM